MKAHKGVPVRLYANRPGCIDKAAAQDKALPNRRHRKNTAEASLRRFFPGNRCIHPFSSLYRACCCCFEKAVPSRSGCLAESPLRSRPLNRQCTTGMPVDTDSGPKQAATNRQSRNKPPERKHFFRFTGFTCIAVPINGLALPKKTGTSLFFHSRKV